MDAKIDTLLNKYSLDEQIKLLDVYKDDVDKHISGYAYHTLGFIYERGGDNVGVDLNKAIACYKKAAECGVSAALFNLASLYYSGRGELQPDLQQAIDYYNKVIESGNEQSTSQVVGNAYNTLGLIYQEGGSNVEIDLNKAITCYKKAAAFGVRAAFFNLGSIYHGGLGEIQPDLKQAIDYYNKVIEFGKEQLTPQIVDDAYEVFGLIHEESYDVDVDLNKAIASYKKADEFVVSAASFNLGNIYYGAQGGINLDLNKAKEYFQKSSDLGFKRARAPLNLIRKHLEEKNVILASMSNRLVDFKNKAYEYINKHYEKNPDAHRCRKKSVDQFINKVDRLLQYKKSDIHQDSSDLKVFEQNLKENLLKIARDKFPPIRGTFNQLLRLVSDIFIVGLMLPAIVLRLTTGNWTVTGQDSASRLRLFKAVLHDENDDLFQAERKAVDFRKP